MNESIVMNTLNGFTRKYLKFSGQQCLYLWDNWQMMGIGLHKCFRIRPYALKFNLRSVRSVGVAAGRCLALSVIYNNNMALASIDISLFALFLHTCRTSLRQCPIPPRICMKTRWQQAPNQWIWMNEWVNEWASEWMNDLMMLPDDPERPLKRISRPHALDCCLPACSWLDCRRRHRRGRSRSSTRRRRRRRCSICSSPASLVVARPPWRQLSICVRFWFGFDLIAAST